MPGTDSDYPVIRSKGTKTCFRIYVYLESLINGERLSGYNL